MARSTGRWSRPDRDAGHEAVGHCLLITVAAAGTLAATRLHHVVVSAFESLTVQLG